MKKHALSIAGLALAASVLTACGGGAPSDASTEDFCSGFTELDAALEEFGADADPADAISALKDEVESLVDTGTPEDIPDDAREGFEITTQTVLDLDDDTSLEELGALGEDISEEDNEKADAFDDYLDETCDA